MYSNYRYRLFTEKSHKTFILLFFLTELPLNQYFIETNN